MSDYYYSLSVDKQVYVDGNFIIGVECKSYTENAMLKRIRETSTSPYTERTSL